MAFLDDLNKKLTEATQNAALKSKNSSEISRLKAQISAEENNINNNYYQIGKLFVAMHSADCEEEFKNMIRLISESEAKIAEFNKQIDTINGFVRCEKCNAQVPNTSAFCSFCGNPMPKQPAPEMQNSVICSSCGKVLDKNMRFCTGCGKPVSEPAGSNPIPPTVASEPIPAPVIAEPVVVEPTVVPPVAPVVAQPEIVAEPVVQSQPVSRFCTNCGTKLEGDAVFCTECGVRLN